MPFEFTKLDIGGLVLITPGIFADPRGFFLESYAAAAFGAEGMPVFVQDNISRSARGVIRGLHFQKNPAAQGKLVQCLDGQILDVAVDIRKGSPWHGRWAAQLLDSESRRQLYIPPGFAHGFSVLSESALVMYKVTSPYSPKNDAGIKWDDAPLGIDWRVEKPVVSAKDAALPPFAGCGSNFIYE
ncbi:MAG: dTDP-4-dehydrorhamnose 3,5-epimerase [Elusimicrobiales bacterium]